MAAARGDPWLREFAEARILADDAFVLLQERREQQQQQADAGVARLSAASRRKLTALSTKVSALEAALSAGDVSAKEVDRRRDMVARLRVHVVQLTELLSKKHDAAGRRCAPALSARVPTRRLGAPRPDAAAPSQGRRWRRGRRGRAPARDA
jgi:hypothetical protein